MYFPVDVVKNLLEFLIHSDDTMIIKSIRLFHCLRLYFQFPKLKVIYLQKDITNCLNAHIN